jgi:hypothetical protein
MKWLVKKKTKTKRAQPFPVACEENHCGFKQCNDYFAFIANNCLDIKGKIIFSKGFKCHLWIDLGQFCHSTLKMHS